MASGRDVERVHEKLSFEELTTRILRERVEGEVLGPIKELVRRTEPRRNEVFAQVLDDPKHDVSVKKTVINELGSEPRIENQELLLRQLDRQDDSILMVVARALGKIGDENALKRLEAIRTPDNPATQRALQFSRSLISYRLRLGTHLIEPPVNAQLVPVREGIRFEVSKAEAATLGKAVLQARKDLPAIALSDEGAMRVTCRNIEYLLVFTDRFDQQETLLSLRNANAVPLVLLKTGLSEGGYFLDRYLFTQPAANGEVMLLGMRPKGDLTLVGGAEISDRKVAFRLNAIESPLTPAVEISGEYDQGNRSWQFTRTLTSTTIAAPRNAVVPRKATRTFR